MDKYMPFLTEFMPGLHTLRTSNSGDPFASKSTMEWLKTLDASNCPHLGIELFTNGLLLPDKWDDIANIHSRIRGVQQSIDAATPATYSLMRRGGKWEKLIKSMDFIGNLRQREEIKRYTTYFCVQRDNFREMPNFVDLCLRYNVDQITFTAIQQWSMPLEEYEAKSLSNPDHPNAKEFMEVLEDPRFNHPNVKMNRISPAFRENTHKRYSCSD
jgi:MoaA/NifB/PqqE/SkfB family radical SAM enzyme